MSFRPPTLLFVAVLAILLFAGPAHAFGAGNIASIAKIEGQNFRHGDIEDILEKLAFIKGAKWTSSTIKRVYFGNWLRDYSQALDVGTLKSVNKETLRLLVWVLSFLSFGYATGEYEVTEERLGVYRPEEHIDNPKDYADNADARRYDARLRPPVHPHELAVDPRSGMKNYIANESGGWATSSGYVKHSLARSIHYGRVYTSGSSGSKGKEEDLCEALRCLGQALHCLEDFSAHSNYVELVLRELGFSGVFPHTGVATEITIGNGRRAFPIVTGTFGGVDFLHSVLGEAQDKFSQTEVDELDGVLAEAHDEQKRSERGGQKSFLQDLLKKLPIGDAGSMSSEADRLEANANAKEMSNMNINDPRGGSSPDAALRTIKEIYPILQFRDRVMRAISDTIEKIPGLSALVEKISDTLSLFVLSLLAPYIRPIIQQASLELKSGSSEVIDSAASHQYEPWTDPNCTDPTHSLLSKDHFSNKLNPPAGMVAQQILQYAVPRILSAWENPSVPVEAVTADIIRTFHHPALRDPNSDLHNVMFSTVQRWVEHLPDRGSSLNHDLGSEGVRAGRNHAGGVFAGGHGACHSKVHGGEWDKKEKRKKGGDKYSSIPGVKEGKSGLEVGGFKVPGALGGMLGGVLDAGLRGYEDTISKQSGGHGGEYKDKDKKDKKDKDKKDKDKDKSHKKDKHSSGGGGGYYSGEETKHKREKSPKRSKSKERKRSKSPKEKKDKKDKDKKDKKHHSGYGSGSEEERYGRKSHSQNLDPSYGGYPGAYPQEHHSHSHNSSHSPSPARYGEEHAYAQPRHQPHHAPHHSHGGYEGYPGGPPPNAMPPPQGGYYPQHQQHGHGESGGYYQGEPPARYDGGHHHGGGYGGGDGGYGGYGGHGGGGYGGGGYGGQGY